MLCLISTISRHGKTGAVYHDRIVNVDVLSLGRAVDQHVFLPDLRVALQHATISDLGRGRFGIEAKSASGIRVNERLVQESLLHAGDSIRIGNTLIRVSEPKHGYDLVLEVEARHTPARAIETQAQIRAKMRLTDTRLKVRPVAWTLFIGILLIFLIIPSISVYLVDYYKPFFEQVILFFYPTDENLKLDQTPTPPPLPKIPDILTDKFWNSGDVASAHHFFRKDCGACHQSPFVRVTDQACLSCHKKARAHVDTEFFKLPKLTRTRCAECHVEHNGKHALIDREDKLCSDCHQDLNKQQGISTELGNAWDFGLQHPQFKPTLIHFKNGRETKIRVSMNDKDNHDNFREESNLEFPHDVHLTKKGLATFNEEIRRLNCENCHVLDSGGVGFEKINYEKHCADCHPLSFEPSDITRLLPHGKVSEIMYQLQEYYGERALKGDYHLDSDAPSIVKQGRFPGESLQAEDRMIALDWAREKAEKIAQDVFEFSLCIECHVVKKIKETPPRWSITPVKINQKWFPKARFSHAKHLTINCGSCHLAQESNSSSDILLPDLEHCQNCHQGIHSPDKLQSTCVDCHGFHVSEHLMQKEEKKPEEKPLLKK
jgi:pSer/pThr/pTyr-binding forkhead associated (FHA) protein